MKFWQLAIDFSHGENFKWSDFSFIEAWHCKFSAATFYSTNCNFGKFYNCEFNSCLLGFSHWYGVTFEKVKFITCDFVEFDTFTNCKFCECEFIGCFFSQNPFADCYFDVRTVFQKEVKQKPNSDFKTSFKNQQLPALYIRNKRCIPYRRSF